MEKKKILIVNVNWVGDVLFSTPFIRALREAYPDSYIACLLHPRTSEMLEGNPRIDEIIIYDEDLRHRGILGKIELIIALKKKRFDIAFILHRSFTKALITYLAGIKERIGYPTKNREALLTKRVDEPAGGEVHRVEYFLNLARAVGIEAGNISYEFFIGDSDRQFVKRLLIGWGIGEDERLVVICPGGNWDPKRWPKENFAKLADSLAERYGAKIVIAGAKKDIALAGRIKEKMSREALIACGQTTLKQLGALLERSSLVIANDTGPMHIAVAMKTNVIALFGPTSPGITGPYGVGNYKVIFKNEACEAPCYDISCKENTCMAAISVEDVLREVGSILYKREYKKPETSPSTPLGTGPEQSRRASNQSLDSARDWP